MIDDIILEVHNAGLELVTLHDRPEGSALGTYYYILEVECKEGITARQLKGIEQLPEIHYLGRKVELMSRDVVKCNIISFLI